MNETEAETSGCPIGATCSCVYASECYGRPSKPIYREAERQRGIALAGSLAQLVDTVAAQLHGNESLHLHDASGPVERCGYCYLRAGRTLGIVASVVSQ